jgi:hypothetical protein
MLTLGLGNQVNVGGYESTGREMCDASLLSDILLTILESWATMVQEETAISWYTVVR